MLSVLSIIATWLNGGSDCGNMAQKVADDRKKVIEDSLNILLNNESRSLLKKHCTKDVAQKIKDRATKYGGDLEVCIRSGVQNLDSGVGLYASDPAAYDVFNELFDPLIRDYHKQGPSAKHPTPDFGDIDSLAEITDEMGGNLIKSTRVRVGRSVDGFPFPPQANAQQRKDLEKLIVSALQTLDGELAGKYYSLESMTKAEQQQLVDDHFLFKDDDRFLRDCGGYKDWPVGRGIYHNDNKTFLVWVQEEDHLRIISMEKGADIKGVFRRLKNAVDKMSKKFKLAVHPNYGNLTFCPSNLGTGMRASVHVKLENLMDLPCFKEIAKSLNIDVRGLGGEHTAAVGGVHDVSNKRRMGCTEYELINEMIRGVTIFCLLERDLIKARGGQKS